MRIEVGYGDRDALTWLPLTQRRQEEIRFRGPRHGVQGLRLDGEASALGAALFLNLPRMPVPVDDVLLQIARDLGARPPAPPPRLVYYFGDLALFLAANWPPDLLEPA